MDSNGRCFEDEEIKISLRIYVLGIAVLFIMDYDSKYLEYYLRMGDRLWYD
jgi:hypothetical protein